MAKRKSVAPMAATDAATEANYVPEFRHGLTDQQRDQLRTIKSFPLKLAPAQVREILQHCAQVHGVDVQRLNLDAQLLDQATQAFVAGRPVDE